MCSLYVVWYIIGGFPSILYPLLGAAEEMGLDPLLEIYNIFFR
jgi:hypothetical protein